MLRAGRPAALIVDHLQLGLVAGQARHGAHEVVAPGGIEPTRAQNEKLGAAAPDGDLTRGLAASVGAERLQRCIHDIGRAGVACKDVVGAEMDESNARAGAGCGHHPRRGAIGAQGSRLVSFRAVDVCVGGA